MLGAKYWGLELIRGRGISYPTIVGIDLYGIFFQSVSRIESTLKFKIKRYSQLCPVKAGLEAKLCNETILSPLC